MIFMIGCWLAYKIILCSVAFALITTVELSTIVKVAVMVVSIVGAAIDIIYVISFSQKLTELQRMLESIR